ncbi:hypothetical protein [Sphingomonas sp.]|uniref:hypothetical protein n=1 Tax=Sphingomonas sp. TaxID=28214 RepID=UPI0035BBF8BA
MRIAIFALLATLSAPAIAAGQQGESSAPPQRVRSVAIERGQACPKAVGDEVVVCTVIGEPYRIPKPLRDSGEVGAANQSWVNRAATVDQVGRVAGGLPDTCSPVGTGGQSGCSIARNQAFAADKRAREADAAAVPGGGE